MTFIDQQRHLSAARIDYCRRKHRAIARDRRQAFADLASEFRAIRSAGNFPLALAMLREAMREQRAEFRDHIGHVRAYRHLAGL